MKALVFLLKTTAINYFKRLKEKPQKAIGPIFIIIWLTFLFLPKGKNQGYDSSIEVFVSIFITILICMFLFALFNGTKRVDSKFIMADVNLIFVSPIKPQTVMLYGIVKKITLEVLTSFYLLYQIANFLKDYNVPVINQIILILSFIIFQLIFCNILKLFLFAMNTKVKRLGHIIRNIIYGLLISTVCGIVLLVATGNIFNFLDKAVKVITYNSYVKYIPLLGWMREIAVQTITGIKVSCIIYIALIILLSALLLYITYSIDLDFYEDMLSSAENNEIVKNIKSGKNYPINNNGKQSFLLKPFKDVKLKLNGVYGAKVLFFKHMNEYFKRSIIFFINIYSIILLAVSIILGIFAKNMDIKTVFLIADVLLFFTVGFGGKIYSEINNYFIFMLPDSPQRKLFYGISSSLIKIFADALLLFLPFSILSGASIIEMFWCIICYIALGSMLSYSGLFAFRIAEFLGFTGMVIQSLFFMFFQILIIIPAILIVFILTISLGMLSGYSIYLALLIYSLVSAGIFSFGCVGIFNDMEFMK